MSSPLPPDRLTDEEMNFVRPGESADVQAWNKQYAFLVDEYRTALAAQDEGWASDRVAEVRKCRSGLEAVDRHLTEAALTVLMNGPKQR